MCDARAAGEIKIGTGTSWPSQEARLSMMARAQAEVEPETKRNPGSKTAATGGDGGKVGIWAQGGSGAVVEGVSGGKGAVYDGLLVDLFKLAGLELAWAGCDAAQQLSGDRPCCFSFLTMPCHHIGRARIGETALTQEPNFFFWL
jgi:hypothetical protein